MFRPGRRGAREKWGRGERPRGSTGLRPTAQEVRHPSRLTEEHSGSGIEPPGELEHVFVLRVDRDSPKGVVVGDSASYESQLGKARRHVLTQPGSVRTECSMQRLDPEGLVAVIEKRDPKPERQRRHCPIPTWWSLTPDPNFSVCDELDRLRRENPEIVQPILSRVDRCNQDLVNAVS